MSDEARASVDAWDRWVSELEDHPLDAFEYDELIATRGRLASRLELAGNEALWVSADAIDARFVEITTDNSTTETTSWWQSRLPKAPEALRYLRGDY